MEYRQIIEQITREAMKPKQETKILEGFMTGHGANILAPGTLGPPGNFDKFIV